MPLPVWCSCSCLSPYSPFRPPPPRWPERRATSLRTRSARSTGSARSAEEGRSPASGRAGGRPAAGAGAAPCPRPGRPGRARLGMRGGRLQPGPQRRDGAAQLVRCRVTNPRCRATDSQRGRGGVGGGGRQRRSVPRPRLRDAAGRIARGPDRGRFGADRLHRAQRPPGDRPGDRGDQRARDHGGDVRHRPRPHRPHPRTRPGGACSSAALRSGAHRSVGTRPRRRRRPAGSPRRAP